MLKLGITGGIGSGKSVVSEIFHLHAVPVYNADLRAKYLSNSSPEIREKLIASFGAHIYIGQKLNKTAFANIIFHNPEKLQLANAIIHPQLLSDFKHWTKIHSNNQIVAMEAALLFEAEFQHVFDYIITVFSPQDIRLKRAMARDGASREAIENRMKNQIPEEEKIKRSHFVILNDETHSLLQQVDKILKTLNCKQISHR